jgi:hypothetical protein
VRAVANCCLEPQVSRLEDNEGNEVSFTTKTAQCACAKIGENFQFPSEFMSFVKTPLGRDVMKFVSQNFNCCLSVHVDNYTIIVPTKCTSLLKAQDITICTFLSLYP